ncbi:hypothetical protein C0J52_21123 [Blattella germanica]|nr:hypothetical protein C0J52_21123 [Blattella germanica]
MIFQRHHIFLTVLLGVTLWASSFAEEDVHSESTNSDKNVIKLPGDVSLPANMLQLVTAAGALVLGFVGVAVILSLVMPLFGIRLCHLLGTCDNFASATTAYSGHNYDYSTAGTYSQPLYSNTAFQKRSLEYVGPILKALSAAYDKYAVPIIKKKE